MNMKNIKGKSIMTDSETSIIKELSNKPSLIKEISNSIRVLVVAYNKTCLFIMENMLHSFGYNVTTCQRAEEALSLLCKDGRRYDVLISEVHLPEMDGFNLLEIVSQKMKYLLVVLVLSYEDYDAIWRVINDVAACDFLVIPVQTKDVKFMFKHVIRKKREIELKEIEPLKIMEQVNIVSNNTTANEGDGKILKRAIRNHEVEGELLHDLTTKEKKPRFVWTTEVHGIFLKAVAEVMAESDRPVPKKIQEKMQNMGVNVTRENVASHLQKFRLNRNKKTNLIQSTPELIKPYPVGECKHVNALPSDPSHHNLITTVGVDSPTLLGNLVSNVVNINETFHEGHVEANDESPNLSDPPFEARIQMIDDTTMNQPFDSMLSPPVSYEIQVQALEDNVAVITSMEPNDYPTIEYLLPGQDCAIEGNGTAPMEIDDPISLFNTNNIYVNNFSIEYAGLNVGYENPAEKNAHVLQGSELAKTNELVHTGDE